MLYTNSNHLLCFSQKGIPDGQMGIQDGHVTIKSACAYHILQHNDVAEFILFRSLVMMDGLYFGAHINYAQLDMVCQYNTLTKTINHWVILAHNHFYSIP